MGASKMHLLAILIFTLLNLNVPAFALKKAYIVYLGGHSHGQEATSIDFNRATDSHNELLGSFLGSTEKAKNAIFYSYNKYINGFAAMLEEEEAAAIKKHPKVISVFLNDVKKLHTTRSWDFLGLEIKGAVPSGSIWKKARYGEDTIIAHLDTGVWPESESFSDEGYGPIPSKWKGSCQNNTKAGVPCNRKLIGAKFFDQGYIASGAIVNNVSARDFEGHGSHTLSTAGGNFVHGANVFGHAEGTAKGGSPKARVASYKVCWPSVGCPTSDILAGFDAAIHDGVDVISVSLGGMNMDYFEDGLSIGAFHAVKAGVVVVCSAGNNGPSLGTVTNVSPWIITVGASTLDRDISNYIRLGNKVRFQGKTLSPKSMPKKLYPLITSSDAKASGASNSDALLCFNGSLDPKKAKGKIVVCLRGINTRLEKSFESLRVGAVGMVLINDLNDQNDIEADPHFLPATHITYSDGLALLDYINSTKSPVAYIAPGETHLHIKPAPTMAAFSSVGPNYVTPEILKPDITAPGVNILAAYSLAASPTEMVFDHRRVPYNFLSGTSMSCPHVAGITGLLKTLHPDWSPSAIRSAIMTTARTQDNNKEAILDSSSATATPLNYGAGHIRPTRAMDPGLIYDLAVDDYLNFLCAIGYNETKMGSFSDKPYTCPKSNNLMHFNYPSITISGFCSTCSATVKRTVKNVGTPGTYIASIRSPKGISVSVEPKSLKFDKIGEEKTFKLTLKSKGTGLGFVFGQLTWSDGKHYVRSPISVNVG